MLVSSSHEGGSIRVSSFSPELRADGELRAAIPTEMTVAPNGREVLVAGEDGLVEVRSLPDGRVRAASSTDIRSCVPATTPPKPAS